MERKRMEWSWVSERIWGNLLGIKQQRWRKWEAREWKKVKRKQESTTSRHQAEKTTTSEKKRRTTTTYVGQHTSSSQWPVLIEYSSCSFAHSRSPSFVILFSLTVCRFQARGKGRAWEFRLLTRLVSSVASQCSDSSVLVVWFVKPEKTNSYARAKLQKTNL